MASKKQKKSKPAKTRKVRRKNTASVSDVSKEKTGLEIYQELLAQFPVIATSDPYRIKSWQMFAEKLAQAKAQNTVLFCVTVNPDILHNKEELQDKYPCQIVSPTEALVAGGFKFIH